MQSSLANLQLKNVVVSYRYISTFAFKIFFSKHSSIWLAENNETAGILRRVKIRATKFSTLWEVSSNYDHASLFLEPYFMTAQIRGVAPRIKHNIRIFQWICASKSFEVRNGSSSWRRLRENKKSLQSQCFCKKKINKIIIIRIFGGERVGG
jgi:hypothetical protein